ncbi:hypothetical protein MMC29_000985, partial [Sticta canariensis]|nr:hypothetical protein [Sticta canariensis]
MNNITTTFSGPSNQGVQVASNSGRFINVNIYDQSACLYSTEGSLNKLPQPDITRQDWCFEKLPKATQAAFNSSERQHDPTCLQDTRVDVLNEIRAWAEGQDERCIYWLNGMAGTGKSTIARTIAREYLTTGRLGASFFFSKGGGDIGHAGKFFTTLAFQLAKTSPILKSYICDAISANIDIKYQSFSDQWRQLILQPLSKLEENSFLSSYIFVIDALDECDGERDIQLILQLLAEAQSLDKVQLRIFLTSRPEITIRHGFNQTSGAKCQEFILHHISPSVIDNDIRIFLEYTLKLIGEECSLDDDWPGEQTIKYLIRKASGLFIWAATACRFICDGKQFASMRLTKILEDNTDSTMAPEKHLDEIYLTVLKQCIKSGFTEKEKKSLYSMLRQILGSMVVLFSPLSVDSLCRLLPNVTKKGVERTLKDLHAILNIPEDQTQPLHLHHPSFRDFLIDKIRCGNSNFWIDEKHTHQQLVDNSIQLMTKVLKQNIYGLRGFGRRAINSDSSQVQQCLPQEVQYACLYWIQHLQMSGCQLQDDDQVHRFLKKYVLHWLEALGWMQKISEGIDAIISLESTAVTHDCPGLYAFIHDIKRFALYAQPAIVQAPLQVYCGALVFAPIMSITLEGHLNCIKALAFSPDGKVLASASEDAMVKLWNANTGVALQTLEGHLERVNAVVFSPDGKVLASASNDTTVKLWNAGTGAALQTLEGHWNRVNVVVFSPDNKVLASASDDATVKLWDAGTGAALQTLMGHSNRIKAVAFSPDSKVLVSVSYDAMVKLWDTGTGAALQTLKGHVSSVTTVAFSPDGKVLASASEDAMVKLWDTGTGAVLQTLKWDMSFVTAVAFSPDGKVLASASTDAMVKLWDAGTGAALQTLKGHLGRVQAVAFSPDGKVLASASSDATVKLWDAGPGVALQTLKDQSNCVKAVAFLPESKMLASASSDTTVKLWDADMGAALQTLEGHWSWVNAVAFSLNGKVLASASDDATVKLWDAGTGAALQTLEGHRNQVHIVVFSPDNKVLASASNDGTVKLWDVGTGAVLLTLMGHWNRINVVAFSPDSKVLVSASEDGMVNLWDTGPETALPTLKGHVHSVSAVAFSPDGKVLASASEDGMVILWGTGPRTALLTLKGHVHSVSAVAFSPDGKVLALASNNAMVKLWNTGTGAALQTLKGHVNSVTAVAFSPDGKVLASASYDAMVKLWDTGTGAALQTLE